MGRFINADQFASTGQGFLGYNMYVYCGNNPANYVDQSGMLFGRANTVLMADRTHKGSSKYIADQNADTIGSKSFGLASVAHGGCGIVASYNALLTLGAEKSFDDVLAYFNNRIGITPGFGYVGLSASAVAGYFRNLGYDVTLSDTADGIDILSQTSDASILYYMFPATYPLVGKQYGAHFVEYHRTSNGYKGFNTNGRYGFSNIAIPSDFAYQNSKKHHQIK